MCADMKINIVHIETAATETSRGTDLGATQEIVLAVDPEAVLGIIEGILEIGTTTQKDALRKDRMKNAQERVLKTDIGKSLQTTMMTILIELDELKDTDHPRGEMILDSIVQKMLKENEKKLLQGKNSLKKIFLQPSIH